MNEPFDSLEAELAGLRPRAASPELKQRIAEQLSGSLSPALKAVETRPRRRWPLALAGGVVAACIALAVLLSRGDRDVKQTETPQALSQPLMSAAFDDAQPSVWTYRRALLRSPGELGALLDRHAGEARHTAPQFAQTRGFGRFETSLEAFPGDL